MDAPIEQRFVKEIEDRLAELRPLVDEYERLVQLRSRLDGSAARPARRRSAEERKAEILALLGDQGRTGGQRVKDLAAEMGLTVPRVVQLLNEMEADGTVERTRDGVRTRR